MNLDIYILFFITTTVVVLTPGATSIFIASQGVSNGVGRAIFGIVGVVIATLLYFFFSATGLASLIAASDFMFRLIKWAGVGYLIFLGLSAFFSKPQDLKINPDMEKKSSKKLFAQGFLIEFSNPKALLYYSSILPQFLSIDRPIYTQFIIMGLTGAFLQFSIYLSYAYIGSYLTKSGVKSWVINLITKAAGLALLFAAFKMSTVTAFTN